MLSNKKDTHSNQNKENNQKNDSKNIKKIISIASGKGGVGKSTVTVNLAYTLKSQGFNVGILDADIYGPSIGLMLGAKQNSKISIIKKENKNFYKPLFLHGIHVISIAFLTDEKTPVIWRGPMVSGAVLQMLENTWWDNLDFLLIDLPPGTGDIQITLVQKTSLAGSIIVTTPQDLALLDVRRAIEMFAKVNVPVLGVIENMSYYKCSSCGHSEAIFGELGAKKLQNEYNTSILGSIPLDISIREQGDKGEPIVMLSKNNNILEIFNQAATKILTNLQDSSLQVNLPDIDY